MSLFQCWVTLLPYNRTTYKCEYWKLLTLHSLLIHYCSENNLCCNWIWLTQLYIVNRHNWSYEWLYESFLQYNSTCVSLLPCSSWKNWRLDPLHLTLPREDFAFLMFEGCSLFSSRSPSYLSVKFPLKIQLCCVLASFGSWTSESCISFERIQSCFDRLLYHLFQEHTLFSIVILLLYTQLLFIHHTSVCTGALQDPFHALLLLQIPTTLCGIFMQHCRNLWVCRWTCKMTVTFDLLQNSPWCQLFTSTTKMEESLDSVDHLIQIT